MQACPLLTGAFWVRRRFTTRKLRRVWTRFTTTSKNLWHNVDAVTWHQSPVAPPEMMLPIRTRPQHPSAYQPSATWLKQLIYRQRRAKSLWPLAAPWSDPEPQKERAIISKPSSSYIGAGRLSAIAEVEESMCVNTPPRIHQQSLQLLLITVTCWGIEQSRERKVLMGFGGTLCWFFCSQCSLSITIK